MFMTKADEAVQTDSQKVMSTMKAMESQEFEQVDQLWVPAFRVEAANDSCGEVQGLEVGENARIVEVRQSATIEFFTLPASEGTPVTTPDYPADASISVITDSFVFAAVNTSLEESLELPLYVTDVDKLKHWKKL